MVGMLSGGLRRVGRDSQIVGKGYVESVAADAEEKHIKLAIILTYTY